jgi:hypothetical protein
MPTGYIKADEISEPSMSETHAGRPPFQPTREQRSTVQVLVSNGNGERVIARVIGIDRTTLRKHFKDELRNGRDQVVAAVGATVVRSALAGNMFAAKYWLATHGGPEWRYTEGRTIAGDPDAPPIRVKMDVDQMTEAEIQAELEAIREKRRIAAEARAMAESLPRRMN